MGLDSVELALAIEDEFEITIPDNYAAKIITVGDAYEYLKKQLKAQPSIECPSQKVFHRVRQALMKNYGLPRESITLDTRLKDLKPRKELAEGWLYFQLFAELRVPEFTAAKFLFGPRVYTDSLTIRQVVLGMMALNDEKIVVPYGSNDDIWIRLVKVIVRQTNVSIQQITPEASFSRDLGID